MYYNCCLTCEEDSGNIFVLRTRKGTESVPRREEGSTGKYQHEVGGVPEGEARGSYQDRMLVFSFTPRLDSRYRHYPIFKSDEAEAIAIAIATAMSKTIAISIPRAKKETD